MNDTWTIEVKKNNEVHIICSGLKLSSCLDKVEEMVPQDELPHSKKPEEEKCMVFDCPPLGKPSPEFVQSMKAIADREWQEKIESRLSALEASRLVETKPCQGSSKAGGQPLRDATPTVPWNDNESIIAKDMHSPVKTIDMLEWRWFRIGWDLAISWAEERIRNQKQEERK